MHVISTALLVLQVLLTGCGLENIKSELWYVQSSAEDNCTTPNTPSRCGTLRDYIMQSNSSVTNYTLLLNLSDITLKFSPGIHMLDVDGFVGVGNGSGITLVGSDNFITSSSRSDQATILCNSGSGFLFKGTTGLGIFNLSFVGCGADFSDAIVGLVFHTVQDLRISGIMVMHAMGYGAEILNPFGTCYLSRSVFTKNNLGKYTDGGNILLLWNIEPQDCLEVHESEYLQFEIKASQLVDSSGFGAEVSLQHYCYNVFVNLTGVHIANNDNNLYVYVRELEGGSGSHKISIANSYIVNGGPKGLEENFERRNSGAFVDISVWPIQSTSKQCKVTSSVPPPSSLSITSTEILGNRGEVVGGLRIIHTTCQPWNILVYNVTLNNNTATTENGMGISGNMAIQSYILNSDSHLQASVQIRDSKICHGYGQVGGLYLLVSTFSNVKTTPYNIEVLNTSFSYNSGYVGGVGLYFRQSYLEQSGKFFQFSVISQFRSCNFSGNIGIRASALLVTDTLLVSPLLRLDQWYHESFITDSIFQDNVIAFPDIFKARGTPKSSYGDDPEAESEYAGTVSIFGQSRTLFNGCRFVGNFGMGLAVSFMIGIPMILFGGDNQFIANKGSAILLSRNTYLLLLPYSNVQITDNAAESFGGGILMQDSFDETFQIHECKLYPSLPANMSLEDSHIQLYFHNNTARTAGDAIYGGYLDFCKKYFPLERAGTDDNAFIWNYSPTTVYNTILNYSTEHSLSVISSSPIGACFCDGGHPDCSNKSKILNAFPGEDKNISMVVVGQRNGVVPATLYLGLENGSTPNRSLGTLQYAQETNKTCTVVTVTVYSGQEVERVNFSVRNPGLSQQRISEVFATPVLTINLQPCPHGFVLGGSPPQCTCEPRLKQQGITCDINTQTIHRPLGYWISYDSDKNGVLIHPHCPFHYCHHQAMDLHLASADDQCDFSRSGLLCGECRKGLSLGLGSSRCLTCSNSYLGLIAIFAAFGITLIALLNFCNLNISSGTFNAVIFYANIVHFRRSLYFPTDTHRSPLSVFISWMNLDLGIETCFFDGMDMYARTWLQFVFPIYVGAIVIALLLLSHYYTGAGKIIGRNSPKVLATVCLLSYAKLLKTVIMIFSFTFLEYPDGTTQALWLYDGNVVYLGGKHIPLFILAVIVTLFLLIPYTLLMVSHPYLQRNSWRKLLHWVRRLKPFLDAYGGPYKEKCHYWPGALLLFRVILFISYAVNSLGNRNVDLLITVGVASVILAWELIHGGLYKNLLPTVLEASVLANLGIISAATSYVLSSGESQTAVSNVFIGLVFIEFLAVVIYHIHILIQERRERILRQRSVVVMRMSELKHLIDSDSSSSESEDETVQFQMVEVDKERTSGEANISWGEPRS